MVAASPTTMTDMELNDEMTSTTTAAAVASIGTASTAVERDDSDGRGWSGLHIASAKIVIPVIHSPLRTAPTVKLWALTWSA